MKIYPGPVILLLALAGPAFGQTKGATRQALAASIITLDKQGWEAWKNNDASWFRENTTEGFVSISSDGISNKVAVIKSTATDCKVAGYSLANIRLTVLDKSTVLLTYRATQDAMCGGKKAPANLQVAATYVRRSGRWLEAMYMQAP